MIRTDRNAFAALLALVALAALCALASADPTGDAVMAAIRNNPVPGGKVGVAVRRLSDGKEIVFHHGEELFQMASNTKILTTSAALWKLGLDYRFTTRLIADGPLAAGVLQGNLVVIGGGDPNFSGRFYDDPMHVPRQMADAVVKAGIREITGDLVMDDRFFDRQYRAPGWPAEDLLWWYAAPVSAISFNDNCIKVVVSGAAPGTPARVRFAPDVNCVNIRNDAVTAPKGASSAVHFKREGSTLVVNGKIAAGSTRSEDVTVPNPPLFFAAALRSALQQAGVAVKGGDRLVNDAEQLSPDPVTLLEWRSLLIDSVAVANRRSQNFYAEQVLKALGAERFGLGTFENGAKAVLEFAAAAHLPAGTVRIVDGCGLSPGNQATPQALAALLEVIYRTPIKDAFVNSLAVNGDAETTLRSRLKDASLLGRIHAKTGTIKSAGVSALSGYAMALDGEVYAFSILSNGFSPGRLGAARKLEDAVCKALVTGK
jgi:D-alanyl-D-alanine carboxypeptidase/D-alanyl-D-alanine-endopeptidase (penicillin-binding protein 4)